MSSPRFAFLTYVARSGSTFLARLVASRCPTVRVLPEFQLPDILLQHGERRVEQLDAAELRRLLALDPQLPGIGISPDRQERIAGDLAGADIRSVIERVVREADPYGAAAPEVVMLKKGSLIEHGRRLAAAFPEARLVHVLRDPRGVANSMMRSRDPYLRRLPLGRGDPYFIGRYWSRFQQRVSNLRAERWIPFTEVRYEALLDDPTKEVQHLAAFLGVSLADGQEPNPLPVVDAEQSLHALVAQPPRSERASAWRFELPYWQGATVEWATREMRGVSGYPPYFLGPGISARDTVAIARGLVFHALRTTGHLVRGVPYYLARPERLRVRARRFLNSLGE